MKISVFDILEELESIAGSNAKKDVLKEHDHNDLLRDVFVATGNPYVVYNVSKVPTAKKNDELLREDDDSLREFLEVILLKLSTREVTGNAAKNLVSSFFSSLDEKQEKWCTRILLRNLRCGVQETTVNKIWPDALKSFAVALAETVKSDFVKGEGIKILQRVTYPVRVEPKLDGLRCIAVKSNGEVTFYTRNGTVLDTMPTIKKVLENAQYDNLVFDGEMLANNNWNDSTSIMMSKKSKKDDSSLVYNIFDAMYLEEWVNQECPRTYSERLEDILHAIIPILEKDKVKQVAHIVAHTEEELKTYFAKCMDEGFEGVMLKTVKTPYIFKRSANILKLKPVVTYEGVIVGHYEGRRGTKREGLFGGFEVVMPNGIVTRLGGGYSDALKADIQLNGGETYLGKIVELEAQPDPLTADGLTVDGKARFPVFCRFRDESDVDPKVIAAAIQFFEKESEQL